MELDDLKEAWKQNPTAKNNTTNNTNIMELIQRKDNGPIAAMKKIFRRQIFLMSFMPLLLLTSNINNVQQVFGSVLFWCYVVFCIGVIASAWYNYRIVSKLEGMDGMVKTNLEQQIGLLEKRKRWELNGLRVALFFFIALIEILPYFQHYRMLDKWHSLPIFIRIGSYAALFLLQFFMNRKISRRNIGVHLTHLKNLMREMGE